MAQANTGMPHGKQDPGIGGGWRERWPELGALVRGLLVSVTVYWLAEGWEAPQPRYLTMKDSRPVLLIVDDQPINPWPRSTRRRGTC